MVQIAGPVVTVILNGKKQSTTEAASTFLLGRVLAGMVKCVRCETQIVPADNYSLLAKYVMETPEFPCWTMCEPCTDRIIEFAKSGV